MPEEIVFCISRTAQGLTAQAADGSLSAQASAMTDLMAAIYLALATHYGEGQIPKRVVLRFETEQGEKPQGAAQLPLP